MVYRRAFPQHKRRNTSQVSVCDWDSRSLTNDKPNSGHLHSAELTPKRLWRVGVESNLNGPPAAVTLLSEDSTMTPSTMNMTVTLSALNWNNRCRSMREFC